MPAFSSPPPSPTTAPMAMQRRARLRGERLVAPGLIDLEFVSVLRRQAAAGQMDDRRATMALQDLIALPLQRARHVELLNRCSELGTNLSFYDAAHVALGEALGTTLLTGDRRLARACGPTCHIETLTPT
jgi:predicted nucleic acid-binding protein